MGPHLQPRPRNPGRKAPAPLSRQHQLGRPKPRETGSGRRSAARLARAGRVRTETPQPRCPQPCGRKGKHQADTRPSRDLHPLRQMRPETGSGAGPSSAPSSPGPPRSRTRSSHFGHIRGTEEMPRPWQCTSIFKEPTPSPRLASPGDSPAPGPTPRDQRVPHVGSERVTPLAPSPGVCVDFLCPRRGLAGHPPALLADWSTAGPQDTV